jgi:hypothetical protein
MDELRQQIAFLSRRMEENCKLTRETHDRLVRMEGDVKQYTEFREEIKTDLWGRDGVKSRLAKMEHTINARDKISIHLEKNWQAWLLIVVSGISAAATVAATLVMIFHK